MRSNIFPDFLETNPDLVEHALQIGDDLFLHPSHAPWEPDEKGIILTADFGPYNKKNKNVNANRDNYLKQEYGKDVTTAIDNVVVRFAYGTGSGIRTHGISLK